MEKTSTAIPSLLSTFPFLLLPVSFGSQLLDLREWHKGDPLLALTASVSEDSLLHMRKLHAHDSSPNMTRLTTPQSMCTKAEN